jgi:hypothetical protein
MTTLSAAAFETVETRSILVNSHEKRARTHAGTIVEAIPARGLTGRCQRTNTARSL